MRAVRGHIGPLWPYAILIAIPAAAFILPDVFGGHLLMTGDNQQQNYPLHVLVGSMLRRGELPFWNAYIFSGTPLMAGFNAGAFYPLVGLFVALPDRIAWIATEVILFSAIAVGMYIFLRALTLSTMACFLGAATFAFSGVVLSQVNHVDMTEGFAAIPFMLLAVLHIVRDGRWRWSVVLGIGFATVILGGAPEAMLDEALLIIAYAAVSAGLDRGRWWRVVTRAGAGAVLALGLAAIQWLPGLAAIANSQRSALGSSFASSGSYPLRYLMFSVVPYLDGSYGHIGETGFFSSYNLPEVGFYVGILPVIAVLTLWHPRWPSRLAGSERRSWYLVGLLGLLLALAANTPLEHLFNAIPLYGHQRLQSRNMIDVSTAMCVLFAGWIDRRADGSKVSVRFDRAVALIPCAIVAALVIWALAAPASLLSAFAGVGPSVTRVHTVREAALIALGFCVTAAMVVWLRSHVRTSRWVLLVGVFVAVDLGLMALTSQLASVPVNTVIAGDTHVEKFIAAHLVPGGRFDVYDPDYYSGLYAAGTPDDNILAGLPSIGGYASIVNGNYESVTQTHNVGDLNVHDLASGALARLDLRELVTVPEYLLVPLAGEPTSLGSIRPMSEGRGSDPVLPLGAGADSAGAPPRGQMIAGSINRWFFGEPLDPSQMELLLGAPTSGATIRVGRVTEDGATRWAPPRPVAAGASSVAVPLPGGTGVGLAVQVIAGTLPVHQAVVVVGGHAYELDGALSGALQPGLWRLEGVVEQYSVFVQTTRPTPIFTVAPAHDSAPPVKVVTSQTKTETVRVNASESLDVVRDVAWDRGWRSTVSVDGGPPRPLPVTDHALVQEVRIPAGHDTIVFRYSPPHLLAASVLSTGSVGGLLVLLAGSILFRRFRRSGRGDPAAVSANAATGRQQ